MNELKSLGIEVKSATEPFDTTTPTGRAMFHMAGMFAEWQREIGLEARNEGMIRAMKEGKWLGGTAPYGYKLNERTQKIEIDKKETSVVKMLFSWLVDDKLSEYKIQKRINSMKVPTKYDRLGKKKKTKSKFWWNRRTIGRILRNEIYTGTFYYRKTKHLGRVKEENNLRPKKDWIKVQDKNLRIISTKLFKRAQEQLKKNNKLSSRNTKRSYALQHKVVCGFDGYHYQCATRCYRSKKGKPRETKYYFCAGTRSYFTPNNCPASTISESRILPPIWKKLKEILANPDLVLDELGCYLNQKSKKKQIQRKLSALDMALDSSRTKRERYAELYAEGSISKDFHDKKIQECEKQTEELQNEKEKLSQLLLTEEERQQRINSVKTVHQHLKNSLKDTPYSVKREVLQRLVEKVVKTGDRLDIEFNFPFKENFLKLTPAICGDSGRMDCPHKQTKTFSIFVTTYILPREEINRRANAYQNFLTKDGTPKSKSRHKVKGRYTLSYYRNKIIDNRVKEKFNTIRKRLENTDPSIQEEYTKRRILKAIINSIGKARENSIVKKDMKIIKKVLKFFLEIMIKEGLSDDRSSDVYNNKNIMGKV